MNVVTVLILVAVLAVIALLTVAPHAPARRNPVPGRRLPATHRRPAAPRLTRVPAQRGIERHAR
ncbi:hypothetical protein [Streptomyces subrutilus]|uniref:Uncharacterized protein n=1 Tax=Streptomyces subrutilus TaxID=36818 RepID=A0A1E5PLJ2_9ACTN|nr:hypothetical protein [Streptomyces subrutilus]OEJ30395.1 hypothetical protein BGK67_02630 [Streptomyces subrutilus]